MYFFIYTLTIKRGAMSITEDIEIDETEVDKTSQASGKKTPSKSIHKPKIEWSFENERILVEWCDVAQCYKWLNSQAHYKYSYRHAWFTIPAITLSTISGTASFAQTSFPASFQLYAPMVIGTVNILIGILTTVQQYLKISELNEAHRVSAISWDKFARNIRIELAKSPKERMDAGSFIKLSRQEFDRLMETSPAISPDIIRKFKKTFESEDPMLDCYDRLHYFNRLFCGYVFTPEPLKDASGQDICNMTDYEMRNFDKREKAKHFRNLKKPDICDIIISAEENRYKPNYQFPYTTSDESMLMDGNTELLLKQTLQIISKRHQKEKDDEERRKIEEDQRKIAEDQRKIEEEQVLQNSMKLKQTIADLQQKQMNHYYSEFVKTRGRAPHIEETRMYFSLHERQLNLTSDIIDAFYLDKAV